MLFANTRKKVFSRRGPNLVVSYIIVQGLGICDQSSVRLFVSLLKEKGVPTPYRLPHPEKSKVAIGCLRNTGTSPLARGRSLKPSVKYVMTGKKTYVRIGPPCSHHFRRNYLDWRILLPARVSPLNIFRPTFPTQNVSVM